jgi:N-dimethylarginine dimethylaminohydrolase
VPGSHVSSARVARPRRFLMCEPRFFDVSYSLNPWMRPGQPVDTALAHRQWQELVRAYRAHGHTVETVDPVAGLPDMVFAANAAVVVDGRVFGSLFRYTERRPESMHYDKWFKSAGHHVQRPEAVAEGEGDFVWTGRLLLAGSGFRTRPEAHREAQEYFGVPVVGLRLVDPYFYHLDTALFVLDETTVVYYPGAFSPGSRQVLARLYPDAVVANREDATAFGLNCVCDGRHVFLPPGTGTLAGRLARRGFVPVPVDMSEFHKAGGGIKCCTQEIRP